MKTHRIALMAIMALVVFGLAAITSAQTPQMTPVIEKQAPAKNKINQSTQKVTTSATATKQENKKMAPSSLKKVVPAKDIAETIMANPELKALANAIQTAGMTDMLKGTGPFTLFAPDDKAFAKMPKADMDALLADKTRLTSVLNYHVIDAKHGEADLLKQKNIETASGQMLTLMPMGKSLMVDNAHVVRGNIRCSNGVIHIIDTVLMPQSGTMAPAMMPK
jgi:uncharacterized surface protein with fasciclin (FAS1) repeats